MDKQKFTDKFIAALCILIFIKILGILAELFHKSFWEVVGTLIVFAVVAVIILIVVIFQSDKEKNGDNHSGRAGRLMGGNSFYIETSVFDRIHNMYEDRAQKYIDEKDYRNAAKVYINLLRDNYRGAKTLEQGELYNEAAVIYLKKLHNKSEAASCYEKAKQYKKAIDLCKELRYNEKVGDLYREINDIKNSDSYYQIVADEYVKYNQMVKASLIYRKKMEKPEEAQKILLKGWNENKDAFNCLNNYFNNIFDVKKLDDEILDLYAKAPSDKKLIYLEAMKYEFKKTPELQSTTRNIAYEIISENMKAHSEIVNELKHFNPEDEVILKDISRYKMGRNKMFGY
ncbi:hypothetical protein ACM39_12720 [Chryseobacterium sp. FH2]|uniref:tetratricopeptide repeat protein n=1 Tax=Chryseobacterium sp. FH2 TaxID=1674291 RepID=UPI00065B05FE|nr:hypothetical protein [Chryseobacterium sp. FH2]KMQ67709.1 hypothetical protein ACM39_12720 [Chryseobacterium sp. FH2]